MTRAFTEIMFTDAVKTMQLRMRTRDFCAEIEAREPRNDVLAPRAVAFIESVDTAFVATSNRDGWPHVQHRGGPKGFIRVLSNTSIGFDDYDGNKQFITLGTITDNPKVALILMDFEHQARLKIWGHAQVVDRAIDSMATPEGGSPWAGCHIVIKVVAWDFNCSKHIVRRVVVVK